MLTQNPAQDGAKRDRFPSKLERLDRCIVVLLPVLLLLFLAALYPVARRPLWYDELFTYYVATSRSMSEFLARLLHVDLNPPLSYLFVRISILLFGDSALSVRVPSIIAFFTASITVYVIVQRRLGN